MRICLNGEQTEVNGAQTVVELVQRLELPMEGVLVEQNGVALHRREWPGQRLSEGDRLEIIRVVAGG